MLQVQIGLAVNSINELDAGTGTIAVAVWLRTWWKDERLAYAHQNSSVQTMTYSCNDIWCPDITPYFSAGKPMADLFAAAVSVYPNGATSWSRPGILRTALKLVRSQCDQ